ncbi:dioxygenase [Limnohabitans sp.]|uniref:dioxygenase family protein n=1 Tax=Limnohabitans sp. TaxID=1907725 RepID=UPI0038BA654C
MSQATNTLVFPTTPDTVLPLVLEVMNRTPDPRLRQLLCSLSTHMHQFVIDNQVTEKEFERAVKFLVGIGQETGETKNEVILAFDLFGVSTLVAMLNNPPGKEDESSKAGLLGPFWRANAPVCQPGDNIVRSETPGITMEVRGVVYDAHGKPLPNAKVDVWQASPVGLYENQDPNQADMNLRGLFTTDAQGAYFMRTVCPSGYPVPTDGPCGELLDAQLRHPNRPAHLHFMISSPGHKVLITQVFADDDVNLTSDPVFGVTAPLVGHFEKHSVEGQTVAYLTQDFHLVPGEMVFPHPPIP